MPEANDEGYEGFEVLIEKTNSWIRDQSDVISITNMQSVIVRKNEGKPITVSHYFSTVLMKDDMYYDAVRKYTGRGLSSCSYPYQSSVISHSLPLCKYFIIYLSAGSKVRL